MMHSTRVLEAHRRTAELARKLRKLAGLMGGAGYRRGLRHGVAAALEHRAIPLSIEPCTVVDVGAHRGQFALFALNEFPRATVHCIEPQPSAIDGLRRLLGSDSRVRIHAVAATAGQGEATMHVSRRSDSSSLLPIGEAQVDAFPGTEEEATMNVPTVSLDALRHPGDLVGPTLMKVDVQGAELEVLNGAARVLGSVDELVVEASFTQLYRGQALAGEVVAHLGRAGFELGGCFNAAVDRRGRFLQADLLFSRPATELTGA